MEVGSFDLCHYCINYMYSLFLTSSDISYMSGYRAAKTKKELDKVEEIPFDKYFFNFEDPEVLIAMTDGTKKGLELWKKTYGFDWAEWTDGEGKKQSLGKAKIHCLRAEYDKFAQDCKKDKGVFKCCVFE